jgi:cystathionine gamma-synthase
MGGAVSIPPTSRHHAAITSTLRRQFRNEYFHADVLKLLANSADYHARSAVLNRNAFALADWLAKEHIPRDSSPVCAVLYPPFTDTADNFAAVMRVPYNVPAKGLSWQSLIQQQQQKQQGTEEEEEEEENKTVKGINGTTSQHSEPSQSQNQQQQQQQQQQVLFQPGHGCLLAIDFHSIRAAQAFYDHLSVFHGPHLGAHHTLAFPFNDAIWIAATPEFKAYLRSFGARGEQVRISVGLEDVDELLDTFSAALKAAEEEWKAELEEKKKKEGEEAIQNRVAPS